MSTEATDADMAKKKAKHKKNKGSTDNSTKKRKREREEQVEERDDAPKAESRPSKKQKNDQRKAHFSSNPVEDHEAILKQHSPFVKQTTSLYLALSPCAHDFALEGLCAEHISPLILTYFAPLKGVLLSYESPRMSEHPSGAVHANGSKNVKVLSRTIDEYAVTYVWLTADFTVFKPWRGTYLEGVVGLRVKYQERHLFRLP